MILVDEGGVQNFLFYGGVYQIVCKMVEEFGDCLYLDELVIGVDWCDDVVIVCMV